MKRIFVGRKTVPPSPVYFCRRRHKSATSCTRRIPPPRSPPESPYRPRAISRFNVALPSPGGARPEGSLRPKGTTVPDVL